VFSLSPFRTSATRAVALCANADPVGAYLTRISLGAYDDPIAGAAKMPNASAAQIPASRHVRLAMEPVRGVWG
jgi:hypothetical protein